MFSVRTVSLSEADEFVNRKAHKIKKKIKNLKKNQKTKKIINVLYNFVFIRIRSSDLCVIFFKMST